MLSELGSKLVLYFDKIRSSSIAPFKLIDPSIEAFLNVILLVLFITSSLDFTSSTIWLFCPSIEVAGSTISLFSNEEVFIGWAGNKNWKNIIWNMD